MKFYILDVFAEEKLAGNQLAVIRGNPSTAMMHRWAQEMNYSETTFITSDTPTNGGYDTRIFTPEVEFEFAGHPTLGTAFIVREEIIQEEVDTVILNEKVGQIPVTFGADGVLWMQQKAPTFGTVYDVNAIADILNLLPDEIDAQFPIQEVSTGTAFIMVPIKTLASVQRAEVNLEAFKHLLNRTDRQLNADALFVFCPEALHDVNQIHARAFVHLHGVPEDPATGSANGCFAGWMAKYQYFGSNTVDVRVEQGYSIKRPSLLLLKAQEDQKTGVIDVHVGGRVQLIARGELVD
ncbi:MAG: PhzF family phenazine biosynthesis protein, partial [Phototrophicaceae bacterium]